MITLTVNFPKQKMMFTKTIQNDVLNKLIFEFIFVTIYFDKFVKYYSLLFMREKH